MKISMISAMDRNRLIGTGERIPWHLPKDSQHFRDYTADKAMLLGRKTFEEMEGWFTRKQRPIIITRDEGYSPPHHPKGFHVVSSVEAAIAHARSQGEPELVVSGGAQIYHLALPFAEELILTEVSGEFEGDAYFPEFDRAEWVGIASDHFAADRENSHAMNFVTYRRR